MYPVCHVMLRHRNAMHSKERIYSAFTRLSHCWNSSESRWKSAPESQFFTPGCWCNNAELNYYFCVYLQMENMRRWHSFTLNEINWLLCIVFIRPPGSENNFYLYLWECYWCKSRASEWKIPIYYSSQWMGHAWFVIFRVISRLHLILIWIDTGISNPRHPIRFWYFSLICSWLTLQIWHITHTFNYFCNVFSARNQKYNRLSNIGYGCFGGRYSASLYQIASVTDDK